MKTYDKKEKRLLFSYLVILLSIGVCIVLAGYSYHENYKKQFRADVENQLSLIAHAKAGEIEHWWKEGRDDAETIFGNKVFAKYIKRYFKNPNDSTVKREIEVWMKEFKTGFNYDAVILTDAQLTRRIIISKETEQPSSKISANDIDLLKSGKLIFSDFYESTSKQKVFLKILIPILDLHQLVGIVELRLDPQTYFYSIFTNLPTPGETSETYLLRREGNEAVYLNELRFQKNTTLKLRVPLVQTNLLAVRAVQGQKGFMEGIGYRGKAVVAYVEQIPNSPWYLVAQSDESEVYARLNDDQWQTMIFGFTVFLLVGFGLAFLWKNQRTLIYQERINSVEALRESEERFRSLYENSTMGIYRTTPSGKILLANDALIKMLGFSSFDDLSSVELDKDDYEPNYDRKQFIEVIETNGEVIGLEVQWTRKDGTPVYIRESAKAIRDSNQVTLYYDGTVEDISEMKKSELERQVIYEITDGITSTDNLDHLLTLIHQSLRKVLYADNLCVALHDPNTGLFSFPYFANQFDSVPEPIALAKSLTAYVFRTGKPLLFTPELFSQLNAQNEVELVGLPSPSWIGIPLQTPARRIGVLILQHYEKENVYSEPDVRFLDSIGSQIAMAIDRKQAEKDLRNERLLLRTVIDNIPDSIYCKDIVGRKTLANKTELNYSGAKSETEVLGKTDFELYPKELADGFFADDQLVIQTGQSVINREEYVIDSVGQKHWLLTSKLPIKDEYGNISGLVGIGRDITDRKQTEEELRESEIKLNVILQSTVDGILAVDGNGKVIKTNRRFAELWNIPQSIIDSGDDQALISFVIGQLINSDEFISKVQQLYHSMDEDLDYLYFKDGRTFERFSAPMVMDGSSIGRVWSFRDITDRKQAEEDLRENEEKYRTLVETMTDGIYRSTHDGKFTEVNQAMVRILGYDSKEELQSIDIKSELYFAEEDRESAALEEKQEEMAIFRLRKKDGSEIWVEDHGRHVLDDNGEVLYHEGSLRDVTERKLAEDEVRLKNEELQKSNAEKDKFFSIIAHDLRSPFNGFLGLTQIMAEDLPSLTMAEVQELAISMKNSATNLYSLLENLLKWSQIQKGSIPFSPEVIQLRSMMDECIAIAFEPAKNKGIELSCTIPEGIEVFADINMLQTVIRNLVSNALKFTPKGGKVDVSAKSIKDNGIEISIHDNGIGMSQTMVNNLFRLDVRTNRKGTDDEPSTGLGLLLCKEFVDKHGGKIRVESEEGKGSTFYFTMPWS